MRNEVESRRTSGRKIIWVLIVATVGGLACLPLGMGCNAGGVDSSQSPVDSEPVTEEPVKVNLDEQDDVSIDKQLFEALRNNKPDVMSTLCPTAKEYYESFSDDAPPYLSLNEPEELKKFAEWNAEELVKAMREEFVQIRRLCEQKGLNWDKASLVKTTGRTFFLVDGKEFNPAQPDSYMALHISDGEVSVVIVTVVCLWPSCKNNKEIETLRINGYLLLDPLTKEERKLLDGWQPGEDYDRDKKVRHILTNRHITKEFISCWKSCPIVCKWSENKWVYHLADFYLYEICEIHFSEDGSVSKVLIKDK